MPPYGNVLAMYTKAFLPFQLLVIPSLLLPNIIIPIFIYPTVTTLLLTGVTLRWTGSEWESFVTTTINACVAPNTTTRSPPSVLGTTVSE